MCEKERKILKTPSKCSFFIIRYLLEITTFVLMSDFSRIQSLYLQGAPPKVVVDEIKKCSEWEGVPFQDQFAHDVISMTTVLIQ